jgi:hypothetical protein
MISVSPTILSPRSAGLIRIFGLVWLVVIGASPAPAENGEAAVPVSFALKDQFNNTMTLTPKFEGPVLVTVADKNGAGQLPGWISPLNKEFKESIRFFAVADLRAVPGLLRGMIRRAFKKEFDYGIAMDWDGTAAKQLNITADEANLFVLDEVGHVAFSVHGEATEQNMAALKDALHNLIKDGKKVSGGDASGGQDLP